MVDAPVVEDKVIQTIISLMDRKNHPTANENEALICAEKIQQLLLKHNLDLGKVEEKRDGNVHSEIGHTYAPMARNDRMHDYRWTSCLVCAIGDSCFCKGVWCVSLRSIVFVGTKENVKVAIELYYYLTEQIQELAEKAVAEALFVHKRTFANNFRIGCANRVANRLNETRLNMWKAVGEECTAMVAANKALVEKYTKEEMSVRNSPKGSYKYNREGYNQGYNAGEKVRLSTQKELKG